LVNARSGGIGKLAGAGYLTSLIRISVHEVPGEIWNAREQTT